MLRESPFLWLLLVFIILQCGCCLQAPRTSEYIPGEVLVKFKPDVSRTEAQSLHGRLRSTMVKHFGEINVDVVKIKEGLSVQKAIEAYQSDPRVEYAEPNYTRKMQTGK